MAATVVINQYWGTDAATKQSLATSLRHDWLSAGVAMTSDLRSTYPITKPGAGSAYSYETWNKLEVTAMGGSTKIDNLRIYLSSAVPTGYNADTNAKTAGGGGPANQTTGVTPVGTDSPRTDTAIPTSDPAAKTITGTLTATGESTFLVTQLTVGTSATAGFDATLNWVYEETA